MRRALMKIREDLGGWIRTELIGNKTCKLNMGSREQGQD